jgi:hypothetical protein
MLSRPLRSALGYLQRSANHPEPVNIGHASSLQLYPLKNTVLSLPQILGPPNRSPPDPTTRCYVSLQRQNNRLSLKDVGGCGSRGWGGCFSSSFFFLFLRFFLLVSFFFLFYISFSPFYLFFPFSFLFIFLWNAFSVFLFYLYFLF